MYSLHDYNQEASILFRGNNMLLSKLVCATTKETPSDVKILSHALMLRAGFIKQMTNGIYSLTMPAQIMATKIENIIREEMNKIDGQEVKFPVVMPRELWESSGRYQSIGQEMVRFKDRTGHDMLLGMTHEEAAVHMAKNIVLSYTQLPCMIYQIQTKFRDEARARAGLIRVKEFTMADAYSFHLTYEDLKEYYDKCYDAYVNIFKRVGLKNFIGVKSDTGMMGGSVAHEFMSLTEIGEDSLVLCPHCGYKANMEVAESVLEPVKKKESSELKEVFTDKAHDINEVVKYLNLDILDTMKAVVFAVKGEDTIVVAFIRGDLEVNESKLKKAIQKNIVPCEDAEGAGLFAGNIGAVGLDTNKFTIVFDSSLKNRNNLCCGANRADYHMVGVDMDRDFPDAIYYDIAKVKDGGNCPICGKGVNIQNGIEIGNIFQLGTKYTQSMGMTVLNDKGEAINPIMGCYGIGVGRAIASVIQESNDEYGIILPISIAPWQVHLVGMRMDDEIVSKNAYKVYNELKQKGVDVLFDDRKAQAGVKFADSDLMGMPLRVVISPRSIKQGQVEVMDRSTRTVTMVNSDELVSYIENTIKEMKACFNV